MPAGEKGRDWSRRERHGSKEARCARKAAFNGGSPNDFSQKALKSNARLPQANITAWHQVRHTESAGKRTQQIFSGTHVVSVYPLIEVRRLLGFVGWASLYLCTQRLLLEGGH